MKSESGTSPRSRPAGSWGLACAGCEHCRSGCGGRETGGCGTGCEGELRTGSIAIGGVEGHPRLAQFKGDTSLRHDGASGEEAEP